MTEKDFRRHFYKLLARFRALVRASKASPLKDTWQYRQWLEMNVKPSWKRFVYDHEGDFWSGEIRSNKGLLFSTRASS
jgi:hypothetical protein